MTRTRSQLFLCAFAAQAGFLTLSPILPDVAAEFGTSNAAVGQLRTLSGLAGGLVALYLLAGRGGGDLLTILRGSLATLGAGSVASAMAPDIAVLAAGQTAIGAGSAGLLTAGIAAAARWPAEHERRSVLTWAIVGQPAAWVVGMPLIGVVAEASWRLTWVALPAAAALVALVSLRNRPAERPDVAPARTEPRASIGSWAAGEFLAAAAWSGALVFAGALLRESYGISVGTTGLVLGLGAATYFAGAFLIGRSAQWRTPLLVSTLLLAAGLAVFGALRPGLGFSAVVFGLLVMLAGARTTLASSFVLEIPSEARLRASGARAAAMQFGYLLGAFVAGTAVAAGGFDAMGIALAVLLVPASAPHVASLAGARHARALQDLYASWRVGDFEPRFDSFGPRFEWVWSQEFPDRPPMSEWLSQWCDWRIEPERWVHCGNRMVVVTRYRGAGRTSGARVDARGAHLWTFRRGRARRLEIFSDPALALATAEAGGRDTKRSYLNSGAKAGKRPLLSSDFRALRARG
jgi:predicted MFS family arabinose efflux permease/ketosteroid isomerase-like protein